MHTNHARNATGSTSSEAVRAKSIARTSQAFSGRERAGACLLGVLSERGISIRHVAERIGTSDTYVRACLSGANDVRSSLLDKIEAAMGAAIPVAFCRAMADSLDPGVARRSVALSTAMLDLDVDCGELARVVRESLPGGITRDEAARVARAAYRVVADADRIGHVQADADVEGAR